MKYLNITLFIGCCVFTTSLFGQNWQVCPPNGITTNPDAPVNNQNPYFVNDFFDWRLNNDLQQYFLPYWHTNIIAGFPTINPFWSSNPTMEYLSGYNIDGSIIDYAPEEGWELIGRNLGLDRNGNEDNELFSSIYFILYNKYTGKLRYFFAINPAARDAGAQSYEVELGFTDATNPDKPKVNGLLGVNGSSAQPLDQKTEVKSVKAYSENDIWWNMVDFVVGYDPCTCVKKGAEEFNPTTLSILPTTITKGDIKMSGRLIGTVADPYFENFPNTYEGNELLSVYDDNLEGVSSVGVETFKRISDLHQQVAEFKTSLNNYNQSGAPYYNAFLELLSAGVSAFPVAEAALGLFDSDNFDDYKNEFKLIGAASKYAVSFLEPIKAPTKKVLPSIMDGEIALTGKSTSTKPISGAQIFFETPGTGKHNNQEELGGTFSAPTYPFYNEVLGTFAMLTTPTVELEHMLITQGGIVDYNYNIYQLKEENLEFLFNPALDINFENTTILASLIFETDKKGSTQYPSSLNSTEGVHDIYIDENGNHVFFTPFTPLECLGNTTASFLINYEDLDYRSETNTLVKISEQDIKNIYLRLMIYYEFQSLDRNGIPNTEVQTITFPVNVQPTANTLVDGLSGVTGTKTLNTTNFTSSQDVQAFNTITVAGNLTASPGVTVNLIANEVIIMDGASIGSGINIRLGTPTACGDVLSQSSINLGTYCTNGAYKANQPTKRIQEEKENDAYNLGLVFQSSPNPFKESTQLSLTLPTASEVSIVLYNILGQEMKTILAPTSLAEGDYNYTLNGDDLPIGVYYATIRWNGGVQTLSVVKH
jgi:hypothetical protein